jgi:hemerythrin-like domain-containing protein
MSPLFAAPAADFDHPIDILDGCHARIRRQNALIEKIAARVADGGSDAEAREAARAVVRFFDTAGADHHRDEEEDLFPALVHFVPAAELNATRALLARLRADHATLDAAWREMRGMLMLLVAGGQTPLDAQAARAFAAAYDRHIALEEAELLPLARRVLDPRVVARLGDRMAQRRGALRPIL